MNPSSRTLSLSTAHSLLGTETRCQVVALLLEVDEQWDVETLAAELVRLDPSVAPDGEDVDAHASRLMTQLYHAALPKLADYDVVDFDADSMTVAPGRNLGPLGERLDESLDYSKAACSLTDLTA